MNKRRNSDGSIKAIREKGEITMKVNMTQVLRDSKGEPMTITERTLLMCPKCGYEQNNPTEKVEPEEMTLKKICITVLSAHGLKDPKVTKEQKYKSYRLLRRIEDTDEVSLKSNDVQLLKDLVGDGYLPLVVGQVWDILDPPDEEETKIEAVPEEKVG